MRAVAALIAAALVAVFASLVIGEYGVAGWVTVLVGVVTGLVIGEGAASIARDRGWMVAVAAAVLAAAGVLWGAYLDSGRGVAPLGWEAAAAPALAAAVAVVTVRTYKFQPPNPVEAIEGRESSEALGDE